MIEYLRKEYRDLNEVALNNDDDKVNEDDAKSKDIEVVEINIGEVLTMLDRLVNSKDLSKKERNSRHHERQIIEECLTKSHINDEFMLEQSLYDRFSY